MEDEKLDLLAKMDNLILNVPCVKFEKYKEFVSKVVDCFLTADLHEDDIIKRYNKNRASEYHYNMQVGSGAGASYIGYQHNSEQNLGNGFTMKIELNPNKETPEQKAFVQVLVECFRDYQILIKGFDIAIDIPLPINRIFVASKTGRGQDRRKGTLYFGTRGKSGYLKVYDKKKELEEVQKKQIDADDLTRVEISFRMDAIGYKLLSSISSLGINEYYEVSVVNDEVLKTFNPVLKAMIYSYQSGYQDLKEFTPHHRRKIKKALESMDTIDLDQAYLNAKEKILKIIKDIVKPEPILT